MSARICERRAARLGVGVVGLGVTALLVVGCSDPDGPTCSELGAQDAAGKVSTVHGLVRDNGLDPFSNAMGIASVEQDVYAFCGISAVAVLTGGNHEATTNLDSPIGDAVDWASYGR